MNTSQSGRPHQILLMERDTSVRELLNEVLVEANYLVLQRGSSLDLVDVPNLKPDLIILDISTAATSPELNFVRHLKSQAHTAHIPIVALCKTYPSKDVSAWTQQNGISELLRKPFDLDEFLDAVQAALNVRSNLVAATQLESQPNLEQYRQGQQSTQSTQPRS